MFSYVYHEKLCLKNVGFGNYGKFKKKIGEHRCTLFWDQSTLDLTSCSIHTNVKIWRAEGVVIIWKLEWSV